MIQRQWEPFSLACTSQNEGVDENQSTDSSTTIDAEEVGAVGADSSQPMFVLRRRFFISCFRALHSGNADGDSRCGAETHGNGRLGLVRVGDDVLQAVTGF